MFVARPRELRQASTDAERKLWSRLRRRQIGDCKFRRQHPVGGYIADFACIERCLIVEADGGHHADDPNDQIRIERLEALGWRVLRFWNNEVLANPDGVLEVIRQALEDRAIVLGSRGHG
ncbi:MAG TPA: endonuclease domain-containing protein [Aliidongia sp.]|nr:endonuclease domain-containing protein [Aliidongia sp.]